MRSFSNLLALATLCTLATAGHALADHHHHSHHHSHHHKNKAITGTRNGVGFIADPLRSFQPKKHRPKKHNNNNNWPQGQPTSAGNGPFILGIQTVTRKSAPIIRDHTLTKPPVKKDPPTVTGSSGLHFVNPFSFTAPLQPGVRDHRTVKKYPSHSPQSSGVFVPNTQGPANRYR